MPEFQWLQLFGSDQTLQTAAGEAVVERETPYVFIENLQQGKPPGSSSRLRALVMNSIDDWLGYRDIRPRRPWYGTFQTQRKTPLAQA